MDQELRDHMMNDDRMFAHISDTLDKIKDNHLSHIQADMATIQADMAWVKWIALAFIGGLIAVYFKK